MAATAYAPSVANDLSCDIKLVDMANSACLGMLEVGHSRRDIEALGYFMELLGERLRERYASAAGEPYDDPALGPSVRRQLVEPLDAEGRPSTARDGEI